LKGNARYHDAAFTFHVKIDNRWYLSRTVLLNVIDPIGKK